MSSNNKGPESQIQRLHHLIELSLETIIPE